MANSKRRCLNCKQYFSVDSMTKLPVGWLCGHECIVEYAQNRRQTDKRKKIAKDTADRRKRLKTRSDWLREAQTAFNSYIRARDEGKPCISCGRHHQGQIHAGHYRTTKAASSVRFNTFNVHAQCQPCNTHLSGNVIEYRKSLVKKYGAEIVERIESDNRTVRYTPEYLQRLKKVFARRARHIKRLRSEK